MGKGHRQGRLGEEIRKIISEMLFKDLKDPRLDAMVSVTAVDVTSDGSYATVYLSVMSFGTSGGESQSKTELEAGVIEGMQNAAGFIRRELGRQIKVRHVPELIFKIDGSLEYGRHIDEIIDSLDIKPDEEQDGNEE